MAIQYFYPKVETAHAIFACLVSFAWRLRAVSTGLYRANPVMISCKQIDYFHGGLDQSEGPISAIYGLCMHRYAMNMIETFLWVTLGFAPTLAAMMTAWKLAQKKTGIMAGAMN